MTEEWQAITEAPGYEVSNLGRVRSWRSGPGPRIRSLYTNKRGYVIISLNVPSGRVTRQVHRLVMEAFVGPRPQGMQVRHLDGDATNNRLGNLKYGTPAENEADRVRHGTAGRPHLAPGEAHPAAKLKAAEVAEIRGLRAQGWSLRFLAEAYGVTEGTISAICRGLTWRVA